MLYFVVKDFPWFKFVFQYLISMRQNYLVFIEFFINITNYCFIEEQASRFCCFCHMSMLDFNLFESFDCFIIGTTDSLNFNNFPLLASILILKMFFNFVISVDLYLNFQFVRQFLTFIHVIIQFLNIIFFCLCLS